MSHLTRDVIVGLGLLLILGNPFGAVIRTLWFANRPLDYVRPLKRWMRLLSGIHDVMVMFVAPLLYFYLIITERELFPDLPKLTAIGIFSLLVVIAYFYGRIRDQLLTPVFEVAGTLLLGTGIAINGYLLWEAEVMDIGYVIGAIGHLPVIALCTMMVYRRHRRFQLATKQEKILSVRHTDVLDYFPDRSVPDQYVVSRDGWERFFWLEGWQKLLLSIGVGGGVLLLLVSLEKWLM